MDVSPHLWDVKNNRASGKSAEAQRINRAVDKIRVEVNLRYQELMKTDRYVTAAKLKDAYLGIDIKQETLLKLFEQHNAEFAKKVGHSRVKGTFQRYITVYKHIREFLPHFKNAFIRYSKIGKFVFDLNEKGVRFNDKDFCFERAVLAHGDYLLEGNTDYWNLLSTETVAKNVKRDLSWKRMLRMGDDKVMQKGKKLVKATFDDIADLNDIIGSLERLCIPQTEEEWRNTLISSPKMFKVCEKGFIYISKEEILLLGKWYLNHYHSELFTYHLWVEKFKDEDIFFEGFCKEYAWQKRSDISPHISIKDFSYKHNKYSIEIYTVLNANHDFDKFQLTFGFNNENKFDYPDEIIEILKELGIENEDETVNWFSWYCKSENSILSKTKYLADALFQLKQKK